LDEHRGVDWYLLHLLPIVGAWSFTGAIVGQYVWKHGSEAPAPQSGFILSYVFFYGGASLLTELVSRPLLKRLARGASAASPSRKELAFAGALGGLVPLAVCGLWLLLLGLPTTLGWFVGTVCGFWIVAASSAVSVVRGASMNRRREELEAEALREELVAP
jgi:hypothetical protein